MQPKFKHDCEDCAFLGHFNAHDVYKCGSSLLARYSDEGSEYASWPKSVFVDMLGGTQSWQDCKSALAIAAALSCQAVSGIPRSIQRFESIREVKDAVYKIKWDMLFGPGDRDIVPDPGWGLEANTAFNHFYIARNLLEQAEHHLAIADAHDRECWKKYRENRKAD